MRGGPWNPWQCASVTLPHAGSGPEADPQILLLDRAPRRNCYSYYHAAPRAGLPLRAPEQLAPGTRRSRVPLVCPTRTCRVPQALSASAVGAPRRRHGPRGPRLAKRVQAILGESHARPAAFMPNSRTTAPHLPQVTSRDTAAAPARANPVTSPRSSATGSGRPMNIPTSGASCGPGRLALSQKSRELSALASCGCAVRTALSHNRGPDLSFARARPKRSPPEAAVLRSDLN